MSDEFMNYVYLFGPTPNDGLRDGLAKVIQAWSGEFVFWTRVKKVELDASGVLQIIEVE